MGLKCRLPSCGGIDLSVVSLFCINQPIYCCCICGISDVQSLGVFGYTIVQMPFSMRMILLCARPKVPFVYGFHVKHIGAHM